MPENRHRYRKPLEVQEETAGPTDHTHEQPRGLLLLIKCLAAAVVLLSLAVGWLLFTTYTLQQGQNETTAYIEGRGTQRDAENERLNERIDDAVCDVLDQLPAGGLFDPIREQYGCGPGIPVDELNPDAAQNLADILGELDEPQTPQPAAEPAQPTSAPDELPPGFPPGTQPTPGGQPTTTAAPTSAPVTPAPTTAPAATSAPPLVDLSTVTDRVCDALGICL